MYPRLSWAAPVLLLTLGAWIASGATPRNQFERGRNAYFAGEFKRAISQFEPILVANPNDAEAHFWLGKSYEMLADINGPLLSVHAGSKAHLHLAKAVQLVPDNAEYRRELFDYLINSDGSRAALREAEALARTTPESDPDAAFMRSRLELDRKTGSSAEYLATDLFLFGPRHIADVAGLGH